MSVSRQHHYKNAFRKVLADQIESFEDQVFVRSDLTDNHSNQAQLRLNRALKAFADEGFIIKLSHNLYAKAMTMNFPDGKMHTVLRDSFESVAIEALNKLGIKWEFGRAIQEYNRGETTQIPMVFSVRLHSRFRGVISAEGRKVHFEGNINAR